jgi:DAACS family dicarboxylate/amino acid:cation (Na+ or H+) symporter
MLHLMFFALIIGIAITLLPETVSSPFVRGMSSLFEITSKIIDMIMKFAPYAVACLIFNNMARFGIDLLGTLAAFILTVLLGLGIHFFGVYSLSVWFLSRINPIDFSGACGWLSLRLFLQARLMRHCRPRFEFRKRT